MRTQGGGGALAGREGRGGSTAAEVSTGLHVEESREGIVLKDSMDKHAKWFELGNGGVWSIHYDAKNPLVDLPTALLLKSP